MLLIISIYYIKGFVVLGGGRGGGVKLLMKGNSRFFRIYMGTKLLRGWGDH